VAVAAGQRPLDLVVGRLDGDPFVDAAVVTQEGTLEILRGDGLGGFLPSRSFSLEPNLGRPALGDLDLDGHLDIAVGRDNLGVVWVLFGDGAGNFDVRRYDPSVTGHFLQSSRVSDLGTGYDSLVALEAGDLASFSFYDRKLGRLDTLLEGASLDAAFDLADLDGNGAKDVITSGSEELRVFLRGFRTDPEPLVSPSSPIFWWYGGSLAVADLDGDGMLDVVTLGASLVVHRNRLAGVPFLRGDARNDGQLDLSDSLAILAYLYQGSGEHPPCPDAWDANGDLSIDLTDAVRILVYLFASGSPPPAPFPSCDRSPGTGLGCTVFSSCW
jgi:hypothetical protein